MTLDFVVQCHILDMKKKLWWWPSMSNFTMCLHLTNGIYPQTSFDCDRCIASLCTVNLQALKCWQHRMESNLVQNHCSSGLKNKLCIVFLLFNSSFKEVTVRITYKVKIYFAKVPTRRNSTLFLHCTPISGNIYSIINWRKNCRGWHNNHAHFMYIICLFSWSQSGIKLIHYILLLTSKIQNETIRSICPLFNSALKSVTLMQLNKTKPLKKGRWKALTLVIGEGLITGK